jgi:hypothetical protein
VSETVQVLPLPKVKGYWQHSCSKYPDIIRVPMSDGKVITYHIDIELPHPCLVAMNEGMERMDALCQK